MLFCGFPLQVPGCDFLSFTGAAGLRSCPEAQGQESALSVCAASVRRVRHLWRCSLQRAGATSALWIGLQRITSPYRGSLEDLYMEPLGLLVDSLGHPACLRLPPVALPRNIVVGRHSVHAGLSMEIQGRLRLLEARKLCAASAGSAGGCRNHSGTA